jgi:hypothetical protein
MARDNERTQKDRQLDNIEKEPGPHGDPLSDQVEPNAAQRQSDAPADVVGGVEALRGTSDRAEGRGSSANGIPAFDEDDGEQRKKQYDGGAELVSKID